MGILAILSLAVAGYLCLVFVLRLIFRSVFYSPWTFRIEPELCDVEDVELTDIHPDPDQRLYVWHHSPTVEGAPVLVFFDGVRGNLSLWNRRWRRIASAGAGFVALSYRGYGGSSGKPSEDGLHEDAAMALAWARKHYPSQQLALHGYSMGCVFAANLAAENRDIPAILEGAPISVRQRAQEILPFLPSRIIIKDRLSVMDGVRRIQGRIMLTHGTRDLVVPPRHAQVLSRNIPSTDKSLELIRGANHVNQPTSGLYPLIWRFLGYVPPREYQEHLLEKLDEDDQTILRIRRTAMRRERAARSGKKQAGRAHQ